MGSVLDKLKAARTETPTPVQTHVQTPVQTPTATPVPITLCPPQPVGLTEQDVSSLITSLSRHRKAAKDIDRWVAHAMADCPTIPRGTVVAAAVAMERSFVKLAHPSVFLDFPTEMDRWYRVVKKVLERFSERLEEDDVALDGTMLKVLVTGRDFLKLILEAQEKIYVPQKMQEFMDVVMGILEQASPDLREKVMAALLEYKEPADGKR